jgi:hypothetical protein
VKRSSGGEGGFQENENKLFLLLSFSRERAARSCVDVDDVDVILCVWIFVDDILRKEDGCIHALEETRQLPRKTAVTNVYVLLVLAAAAVEVFIMLMLIDVVVNILWLPTEFRNYADDTFQMVRIRKTSKFSVLDINIGTTRTRHL